MKLSERQKHIMQWLHTSNSILPSGLMAQHFGVSVQTIRKDMNEMSDLGLVRRVHGGIRLPSDNDNLSFTNRELLHFAAKEHIAQQVAQALPPNSSIFLGIGTTPKQVAQALLDHSGLTVVTNNINVALILSRNPDIQVHLAGGLVRSSDEDTIGEVSTAFYRRFNIQYGIFGVGGISQHGRLLDFYAEEAHLNRAIIEHSQYCWLVADQHKYGRYAPVVSGQLSEIDRLFTDAVSTDLARLCHQYQVDVFHDTTHEFNQKE